MADEPTVVTPTAFVCHASEDKDRFATLLAESLQAAGVDTFFDAWDVRPGDDLVDKVFGSAGLDRAGVLVVVIVSRASLVKPWVREEISASTIRRIRGRCRVLPVLIDEVDPPAPLAHLRYLAAWRDGYDATVAEVVDTAFDRLRKPPLGAAPAWTVSASTVPRVTGEPVDDLLLTRLADATVDLPFGAVRFSDGVRGELAAEGVNEDQFEESWTALAQSRLVTGERMLGAVRWYNVDVADPVLLAAATRRGVDVSGARRRLLAVLVNDPAAISPDVAAYLQVSGRVARALVAELKAQGLVDFVTTLDGPDHVGRVRVTRVNPLARRHLRRQQH